VCHFSLISFRGLLDYFFALSPALFFIKSFGAWGVVAFDGVNEVLKLFVFPLHIKLEIN